MVVPYRVLSRPTPRSLRVGDIVRLTDVAVTTLRERWQHKTMTRQEFERGFFVPPHGTVQSLTDGSAPLAYVRWDDPFVPDTWWRVEDITEAPPCGPTCHGVGPSGVLSNTTPTEVP